MSRGRIMGFRGGGGHGRRQGPVVKAQDAKGTLAKLWAVLGREKKRLLVVFFLVTLSSLCTLAGPFLIGKGIDAMSGGAVDFTKLGKVALTLLIVYSFGALFTWLTTYLMAEVANGTVRELRRQLFAKLVTLPLKFFETRSQGELMSRLTNDIESINNTLNQSISQFFSSLLTVTGSFLMMLYLSPLLTALSLITIPIGFWFTAKIAKKTRTFFGQQQMRLGALNGFIEETISGQKVVAAFAQEPQMLATFGELNEELREEGRLAEFYSGLIPPLMLVLNNLSFALVAAAGGWLSLKGQLSIGVIASFLNYSRQFARPINEIANQFNLIQSAIAGAERVFEVMEEEPEEKGGEKPPLAGRVEFVDVSFAYNPGEPVLEHVDLLALEGQRIALVGPTGAGKTTITNLLSRFYELEEGQILLDGIPISQIEKHHLRRSLGVVLQDTYLFAATVRENIRYGKLTATDNEVEAAAKLANAYGFIQRLPQGFETLLSQGGSNLSQGQRQLLTIARAILADPAILILDEATSSVDTRTEVQLQTAMEQLMEGRTSFIIAHRLSTIKEADQILVINQGKIVQRGTHEELMASRGFYFDLATAGQIS